MNKFIFIAVLLCMANLTVFSENVTKESLQNILENNNVDPFERYKIVANALVRSDLSSEQALLVCETMMVPFCEKIEDAERRNLSFANTYDCIRMYNNRLENNAEVLAAIKTAVSYLEKSEDLHFKANFYRGFGNDELRIGDRKRSFDYFNRSIAASEQIPGDEQMINVCYYMMVIPFQEVRDYRSMADIIGKMKKVAAGAKDETAAHHLYGVQAGYFESQINPDSINPILVDSALYYAKKAIKLNEKYGDKIHYTSMPVWNYYNVAVMYDLYFKPVPVDSVELYLNKAEKLNAVINDVELDVSLKDLRAWSFFYKKEYQKAESMMLEVISIIDKFDRNTFIIDRCEAYDFMVTLYKETGDLQKALHYGELYTKVYKERFDSDKNRALRDLTMKYDVEKKETEIEFLKERNAYAVRLNVWGFATAILMFTALVFGTFNIRLRRRNYEQQIYQSAMEAEMSRQELEYIKDGIRPSRAIVSKLIEMIQSIPISTKDKAVYLERLATLDFDTIEKQYLAAKTKLSAMDMKYIICFFIDMSVPDISMLFNIEPTSVHTVRYRIKKKFGKADTWSF